MENEKKNGGMLVGILIGIVLMLLVVVCLFATGTISFKETTTNDNGQTSENNQTDNIENATSNTNTIQTKLVDNLNCSNSETTFNGITVKIEQKTEDMICQADTITINGTDIQKYVAIGIDSYEIYDTNVIIMSHHTGGSVFTIFSTLTNSVAVEFSSGEKSLEGFFVKSYSTNGNIITINAEGCGAQCGEKGIENLGVKATYEIEYLNNSFSEPKLISKTKANE